MRACDATTHRTGRGKRGTDSFGETPRDLFADTCATLLDTFADSFEALAFADFHYDLDLAGGRGHVRAVEVDDVDVGDGGDDGELAEELLHGCLAGGDGLPGHDDAGAPVLDLVDGAACALAEAGDLVEDVVGPVVVGVLVVLLLAGGGEGGGGGGGVGLDVAEGAAEVVHGEGL